MSNLKCPFCQQKLDYDDLLCSCINEHCEESFDMVGTELLWQKVIDLKQEIDSTRKALDVAVDAIRTIKYSKKSDAINLRHKANKALIEIYKIKNQTKL